MDYELVEKMKVEELKSNFKIRGIRVRGTKKILIARVFAARENGVQLVKTAVEIELDLINDYKNKLKIDDFPIPDPFKIPHGWMEEDEGMTFWPMLSYPDIFNFLIFYPSELGSKDLSDYKNSKAYSYYKSGWLQPLQYHNLSGSKYTVSSEEYTENLISVNKGSIPQFCIGTSKDSKNKDLPLHVYSWYGRNM